MYNQADCLRILKEMAESKDGRRIHIQTMGMNDDEQHEYHQIELLLDAGHAERVSDHLVRITMDGYNFIRAIESDANLREKFLKLIEAGKPYLSAAKIITEAFQAIS